MTKAQAYDGLPMHADQVDVTTDIAAALIQEQFPRWSGKPIQLLASTGTVNAIFRIGDDLSARFPLRPADPAEALAVMEREAQASAELAQVSPFPVPEPVALGKPGAGYAMPWSVQTWLPGTVAFDADPSGSDAFAEDLAAFISALRNTPTRGRLFSGDNRGGALAHHDDWMAECFEESEGLLDVDRLRQLWSRFRELPRTGADVMSHGDLIPGNVLVTGDRLGGVLDTGGFGPADPDRHHHGHADHERHRHRRDDRHGSPAILGGLKTAIAVNAALVVLGALTSAVFLRGARPSARSSA